MSMNQIRVVTTLARRYPDYIIGSLSPGHWDKINSIAGYIGLSLSVFEFKLE